MRALLLLALLLPALHARAQMDDETPPLRRDLAGLHLGDKLKKARALFPATADWPVTVDKRTGVSRCRVDKADAKNLPAQTELLYLGFKDNRLVEIEQVYDLERTRVQSVGKTVNQYALTYGPAKETDEKFWWSDKETVLRVFSAELPAPQDGPRAVAWRTAVQVFDRGLFSRGE